MKTTALTLLSSLILLVQPIVSLAQNNTFVKPRIFVTTDLGADPDDIQSMVRLLVQSNEFDIEGLVTSTGCWRKSQSNTNMMSNILNAYASAYNNLSAHSPDFPTPAYLRSINVLGQNGYGMGDVGSGQDSPGSELLIAAVDKPDPRPIWVQFWGGANTLAQAIWKVQNTRSAAEFEQFMSKIRVYDILGQGNAGTWMAKNFPDLIYIRATNVYSWQPSDSWLDQNVQNGHGPLGNIYPDRRYATEGDTPAFLHSYPNGLNNPDEPWQGGWGGRFGRSKQAGIRGMSCMSGEDASYDTYYMYGNASGPQDWQPAINNDFQARMDWARTSSYSSVNHHPIAVLNGNLSRDVLEINAAPGSTVTLSAVGSTDPDGNSLNYSWSHYSAASTYGGSVAVSGSSTSASVQVPAGSDGTEIHVILTITDNGSPSLYAYRRAIIKVSGPVQPPGNSSFSLEAECGIVGTLFNKVADANASGDSYVTVQPGNNSPSGAPGSDGQILYTVNVEEAGTYALWARVITPNGNDDSFWVQMDGGSWLEWNNIGPNSNWTWEQPTLYALGAGTHTLAIGYREDGALLDKLYLTNKGDTPSGEGPSSDNCGDSGNTPPTANAGPDQNLTDNDGNGNETVTLNGTGSSDSDGSITTYIWSENGTQIASGATASVNLSVGTHTILLTVTDDQGASSSDQLVVNVSGVQPPDNFSLSLEAECGIVGALFNKVADANASGDSYVTVQSGNNSTSGAPGSDGQILYTINVEEAGAYALWARVITPNATDDSFWVQMDGGSWLQWNNIGPNSNWTWEQPTSYTLSAGTHTLAIGYREDGALLDKLYLTNEGDTPSGEGPSSGNCGAPVNTPPTANAGPDQNLTDNDGNGNETVTLNGTGSSDSDGSITTYIWSENGTQIASGATASVNLSVGTHTILLTVTDDQGASSSDQLVVNVDEQTTNGNISVRALGTDGSETLQLELDGTVVTTWTMSTSFQVFTYTGSVSGVVRLNFTNDGEGRDIQVDYLEVSGTTYQAEDQAINTAHFANGACGGGGNSEIMHCNGYIQFNIGNCADSDGDGTDDCADNCPNDPNKVEPGQCGCGVPEGSCGESQFAIPGGNQGLAACKAKFVGNIMPSSWQGQVVRSDFGTYWNQVTPENAGKWGSVESSRDSYNWSDLDQIYNYAQQNNIPFKQHVMIWGNQQPNWLSGLSASEQLAEVEEWYSLFAQRYPNTKIMEVVNESLPGHAGAVAAREAMGGSNNGANNSYLAANPQYGPYGTGWDYIIYACAKARQYFPNAILLINDYGIISGGSAINQHLEIVNILKDRGLVDGIGIQAHAFSVDNMSGSQITNNLNLLDDAGLPIHVTELDIRGSGGSESSQRDRFAQIFPAFYEHPAVAGVTLWGYVETQTWLGNTGILNSNGSERLAMQWLKDYMASQPDVCSNLRVSANNRIHVETQLNSGMEIFPNPMTDLLNFRFDHESDEEIKITVFNMAGVAVKVASFTSTDYALDVSDLLDGFYLIRVSGENLNYATSIVK